MRRLFESPLRSGGSIFAMEGLRGFAVFMVFVVHYSTLIEPWLDVGSHSRTFSLVLRDIGNAGVDLFFVLSGYLIYGSLISKPRSLPSYFARRVERIYPAFLTVLAIYLALSYLMPSVSKIPSGDSASSLVYILQNLLLLPGLFPINPIITVAWSLSYEMFYYLMVPLVIGAMHMRSWRSIHRIYFFVLVAAVAVLYALQYGGQHVRLIMFLGGVLLLEARRYQDWPRLDWAGVPLMLAGLVAIEVFSMGPMRFVVLLLCFSFLCYSAFGSPGVTRRIFCWTPLRWLGNMSYSYYLIHGLALKACFMVLAKMIPPTADWSAEFWWLMPVMFVLTMVPAGILFALVEKPFSFRESVPDRVSAPATSTVR